MIWMYTGSLTPLLSTYRRARPKSQVTRLVKPPLFENCLLLLTFQAMHLIGHVPIGQPQLVALGLVRITLLELATMCSSRLLIRGGPIRKLVSSHHLLLCKGNASKIQNNYFNHPAYETHIPLAWWPGSSACGGMSGKYYSLAPPRHMPKSGFTWLNNFHKLHHILWGKHQSGNPEWHVHGFLWNSLSFLEEEVTASPSGITCMASTLTHWMCMWGVMVL